MPIKTNETKPSYSRYNFGSVTLSHKGRPVTTSVGSSFDDFIRRLPSKEAKKGRVPFQYANRPDLISNIFYDTPGYWWYVMQYNGIVDPFEQLNPGDTLDIPEL
jgi:hypothetical protein